MSKTGTQRRRSSGAETTKQLEAGRKAEDVGREAGVSKHTIYAWKAKYGGMDVSQAQPKDCGDVNASRPDGYLRSELRLNEKLWMVFA
jgi:hypothetical protein